MGLPFDDFYKTGMDEKIFDVEKTIADIKIMPEPESGDEKKVTNMEGELNNEI